MKEFVPCSELRLEDFENDLFVLREKGLEKGNRNFE